MEAVVDGAALGSERVGGSELESGGIVGVAGSVAHLVRGRGQSPHDVVGAGGGVAEGVHRRLRVAIGFIGVREDVAQCIGDLGGAIAACVNDQRPVLLDVKGERRAVIAVELTGTKTPNELDAFCIFAYATPAAKGGGRSGSNSTITGLWVAPYGGAIVFAT